MDGSMNRRTKLAATMVDVFPETSRYRPDLPKADNSISRGGWGPRHDLRDGPKDVGWLGPMRSKRGDSVMTEYSNDLGPQFVPTLNRQEVDYLLTEPKSLPPIPTQSRATDDSIFNKSKEWATERRGRGQSPFYNQRPVTYTDDELSRLNQDRLLEMRKTAPNQAEQDRLANYEHRAFARETVAKDPFMAPLLAAAVPFYAAEKALPKSLTGNKSRSNTSLEQVRQGFYGIGDGMRGWFK